MWKERNALKSSLEIKSYKSVSLDSFLMYPMFMFLVIVSKNNGICIGPQTLHRGLSDLPDLPGDTAGSPQAGMPALLLPQVSEECGQGQGRREERNPLSSLQEVHQRAQHSKGSATRSSD